MNERMNEAIPNSISKRFRQFNMLFSPLLVFCQIFVQTNISKFYNYSSCLNLIKTENSFFFFFGSHTRIALFVDFTNFHDFFAKFAKFDYMFCLSII